MYNHYYRPLESAIVDTNLAILGNEDTMFIVVKAANGEEAFEFAKSIVNMEDWELDHVSDPE